jgi:hypothetical protein
MISALTSTSATSRKARAEHHRHPADRRYPATLDDARADLGEQTEAAPQSGEGGYRHEQARHVDLVSPGVASDALRFERQLEYRHEHRRIGFPVDRVLLDNVPVTGHTFCVDTFLNYTTAAARGLLRPGVRYVIAGAGLGATFSAMVVQH